MNWIEIDTLGIVITDRIVAVGPSETAAMRRLLAALPLSKIVSLTGGQRRQSVIILDSDHVVVTAVPLPQLVKLLADSEQ